jgi:hypothetical protein
VEADQYIKEFFDTIKAQLSDTRIDVERRRASYKNSVVTARWSDYFWDVEMKSAESEPLRRLYDPSNARSSELAAEYFVDALLKAAGDDPLPAEMRPPRRGRRHFGKRPAT